MAALKEHVKLFIVQHLACFDTPSEVVELVKEEFGIVLDRGRVGAYDPTTHNGRELGEKLKLYFNETREQFLKDFTKIPLANKSVRIRELSKLYRKSVVSRNSGMAKELLEQIAKEEGGVFSNKVKVAGDSDNPILMLLQQIGKTGGGSMPIAEVVGDDDDIEIIENGSSVPDSKPVKSRAVVVAGKKPKPNWNVKT
jgi:hypothetical protein